MRAFSIGLVHEMFSVELASFFVLADSYYSWVVHPCDNSGWKGSAWAAARFSCVWEAEWKSSKNISWPCCQKGELYLFVFSLTDIYNTAIMVFPFKQFGCNIMATKVKQISKLICLRWYLYTSFCGQFSIRLWKGPQYQSNWQYWSKFISIIA